MASRTSGETRTQADRHIADAEAQGLKRLQSYVKECANIFQTSGMIGCRQFLINKQEEWKTLPLDIGVIGFSGVGKSSFINAIRYIDADHPLAAGVGVVETTMSIKEYKHPTNKLLKFWDLPGAGTSSFPKNTYLERIHIDRYDFFLVMIKGRSTEMDIWLCQEISKRRKQLYIVRTNIDDDLRNNKRAHPRTHREDAVMEQMRQNTTSQVAEAVRPIPKVFLIDNFEQSKFDFPKLERSLAQEFPEMKQQAFVLSMSAHSEEMVTVKAKELRSSVVTTVIASQLVAAEPVPGLSVDVDVHFIIKQSTFYFEQLGLGYESLVIHAKLIKASPEELQAIVDEAFGTEFFSVRRMTAYIRILEPNPGKYNGFIGTFIFLLKKLFGLLKPESISLTCQILEAIINKTEKVALQVVKYQRD